MTMTRRLGLTTAYVALALIWGSSFLLIKEALVALTPGQVAVGRIVLGAVTLRTLMVIADRQWPREPRFWGHMAAVGLLLCVVPFTLFAWAGESLPSGLSAILNASTPLMTAVATTAVVPSERMGARQGLGIALGAAGVVVVVAPWGLGGFTSIPGQLACLGATACYGLGFAYLRRFVVGRYQYDSLTISTVQLTTAAAAAVVVSPFLAAGPLMATQPALIPIPLAALALLGVFGTGIAYIWNTAIVTNWGPIAASTVTYLTPLVGVALGALVLGETLSWNQPVGGAVVIAGVVLAHRAKGSAQSRMIAPMIAKPMSTSGTPTANRDQVPQGTPNAAWLAMNGRTVPTNTSTPPIAPGPGSETPAYPSTTATAKAWTTRVPNATASGDLPRVAAADSTWARREMPGEMRSQ
jgi:drug/metabolite transporter (DMT)-like permease